MTGTASFTSSRRALAKFNPLFDGLDDSGSKRMDARGPYDPSVALSVQEDDSNRLTDRLGAHRIMAHRGEGSKLDGSEEAW